MASSSTLVLMLATMLAVIAMSSVDGDDEFAKDKQECAPQLVGLSPCLGYVQEGAHVKTPTPDCCTGLKKVLGTSRKCLCLLVKYRDEPDLGLKINATAALSLPSLCHDAVNVSECPALLHLSPGSSLAKEFDDLAKKISGSAPSGTSSSTPSTTPSVTSTASSVGNSGSPAPKQKNDGGEGFRHWLAPRQMIGVVAANLVLNYLFLVSG